MPASADNILVPVSAGELLDKITILEIKVARIRDASKRDIALDELKLLLATFAAAVPPSEIVEACRRELREVNEKLWDIEDEIRIKEKAGEFGAGFIALARSVYLTNDRRAEIKRRLNTALGSAIMEVKEFKT